jgi:hypothetical protein
VSQSLPVEPLAEVGLTTNAVVQYFFPSFFFFNPTEAVVLIVIL